MKGLQISTVLFFAVTTRAKIVLRLLTIVTPILGLYVESRLGIEADVNGKQDEKYDDSLITNQNFRKGDNSFSGWRRSHQGYKQDIDHRHPVFRESVKSQISGYRRLNNLRRLLQNIGKGEAMVNRTNDVIDVKFRMDKPSRKSNDEEFAYHDNMERGEGEAYHDNMERAVAGDIQEFEENLKQFELKKKKDGRHS